MPDSTRLADPASAARAAGSRARLAFRHSAVSPGFSPVVSTVVSPPVSPPSGVVAGACPPCAVVVG
ncbi:hypothetical protein [Achromobacter denitrificans]|uniref:Uncharacterized protein n=1 Tax=Achromobacter denitrificans TaxID=32002 RepID=A0A6N0JJS0_ACHDE|nr:hypothetical protein [Achromobacter denitrificans]QKH41417.1 hypothetical protein FOC82_08035 [Achromobacter denitrificans]QKH51439.1 hypothetical protein FOC80_19120 [Achromobacter denitrificans]QKQ47314.1 hypothetical protein FOC81_11655 [Achromobacter denitrificans]